MSGKIQTVAMENVLNAEIYYAEDEKEEEILGPLLYWYLGIL